MELAAETLRDLGLALAGSKTRISRSDTAKRNSEMNTEVLSKYLQRMAEAEHAAADELDEANSFLMSGPYGELFEPETPTRMVDDDDPLCADRLLKKAAWLLFDDWQRQATASVPETDNNVALGALQNALTSSISLLSAHTPRLSDKVLSEWVFRDPSAFGSTCTYILNRLKKFPIQEDGNHWASLATLVRVARRTPWTRIWLLHTAGEVAQHMPFRDPSPELLTWLDVQLRDPNGVVRSEAAWVASILGRLDSAEAGRLYREATPLTQSAIAAAVARQRDVDKTIAKAIREDGVMNRKASEWAVK
jgi:RNA-directed DNA polymerase